MIKGRAKGVAYEQALAKKFRENGYPECVTARFESKRTDDSGVDLCFLPINVQAKAVEKLSPSLHDIISKMPNDKPRVVFHKRNRKGSIVAIEEEFFFELLELYDRFVLT